MNSRELALVVLMLVSAGACTSAADLPRGLVISQRNQEVVLKYLRPVLMSRGGPGRIDYSTVCAAKDGTPLPFPRVEVVPPSKGKTGLAMVREIFKNDKNVAVSEEPSRVIRVKIGQPVSAILRTRIRSVTLTPDEQYNAQLAIAAILNSNEFQAAMRQLRFDQPFTVFDTNIVKPGKGLPHLPASIKDMTVDQALDAVARTFKGIVIYETCVERGGKHLVSLDFVQVAEF
jgi:hypothetical protein